MILGTISAVDDNNGLQLIIDGEDTATTKKYTYMASYVPAVNDRVLIEEISGSYVIMGKIISDKDLSGIARTAETATNATNATTAATCTGNAATATVAESCSGNAATATTAASCSGNAATATRATTADSCSGNAATATTASSCTGNAATATTASSCSGNAATATISDKTKGFDYSVSSLNGMLVTRVDKQYNSQLGMNIVTDVQTTWSQNFTYK